MNWFTILKLAMPVMQPPSNMTYMDIGHEGLRGNIDDAEEIEELWVVTLQNFQIITQKATGYMTHRDIWPSYCDFSGEHFAAKGRYSNRNGGICSIVWGCSAKTPKAIAFQQNRVMRTLENHYGLECDYVIFGTLGQDKTPQTTTSANSLTRILRPVPQS